MASHARKKLPPSRTPPPDRPETCACGEEGVYLYVGLKVYVSLCKACYRDLFGREFGARVQPRRRGRAA